LKKTGGTPVSPANEINPLWAYTRYASGGTAVAPVRLHISSQQFENYGGGKGADSRRPAGRRSHQPMKSIRFGLLPDTRLVGPPSRRSACTFEVSSLKIMAVVRVPIQEDRRDAGPTSQ